MRQFSLIWLGQLVSLLGSAMTRFALMVWIWELTGEATSVVLVGVLSGIVSLLSHLFAGPLVDQWSRKIIIIVSDLGAGVSTIILILLLLNNHLEIWHIYVAGGLATLFGTFHYIAFSAAVSMMLPKEQYARASAMLSIAQYASSIGAPVAAGVLLPIIDITGIMVIDIVTFLFAVTTLSFAVIPQPEPDEAETEKQPFFQRATFGIRYILRSSSLTGLMLIFLAFEATESVAYPLIAPMILARTGNNETILGFVQAAGGVGGVVGGLILTFWGGPKRRIHGLLIGLMLTGLLGDMLLGLGQTFAIWLIAAFSLESFIPLAISSSQAIWQVKVPPAIQGRVFAARSLMAGSIGPFTTLFGGLMADRVFEPGMMAGGHLAGTFGGIIGTGSGAGMALLIAIFGLLSGIAGILGYLWYPIRNAEDILSDFK